VAADIVIAARTNSLGMIQPPPQRQARGNVTCCSGLSIRPSRRTLVRGSSLR
jgi:hypothetical protein